MVPLGHIANVINRTKYYFNQIRGSDSEGLNFLLFHRKEKSPLTQDLNYHSACEKAVIIIRKISS